MENVGGNVTFDILTSFASIASFTSFANFALFAFLSWTSFITIPTMFGDWVIYILPALFSTIRYHMPWQLMIQVDPPIYGGEAFGGPHPIGVTIFRCAWAWVTLCLWLWSTILAPFLVGHVDTPAPALLTSLSAVLL